MQRALGLVVIVLVAGGCKREHERKSAEPAPVKQTDDAAPAKAALDAGAMYITTASEADARVKQAFPNGVATEDARALVGTAPPPPDDRAPDPRSQIVVEIAPSPAVDLATTRAALAKPLEGSRPFLEGMLANATWEYVEDAAATGPYTRVVAQILVVDDGAPTAQPDLDRWIAWSRAALGKLGKQPVTVSMTSAQAHTRAAAALDLKRTLGDDAVDVGIVISAPKGQRLADRLVWDVVYSAGFRWGDGDYFHWVPSPDTDVSQGIGMGTSRSPGYFFPEWVARTDLDGIEELEMSFNVPRTWQPDAVFEVMLRAATYMAKRLGGTLHDYDGKPFDEAAARARVTAIVKAMAAAGMTPGTGLALQVF